MDPEIQLIKFNLTGAQSFSSEATGLLRKGEGIFLPPFMESRLPPVFSKTYVTEKRRFGLSLEGGIGDKIYSVPVLSLVKDFKLGIEERDEKIFRLVKDKTRPIQSTDTSLFFGMSTSTGELQEEIAKRLGIELKFGLPVMETTEDEKKTVSMEEENIVVICLEGTTKDRSWIEGLPLIEEIRNLGYNVYAIEEKNKMSAIPLVERAKCVVSVNTSLLPMAGAFQVPLVAIDTNRRCGYFLDVERSLRTIESALYAFERQMKKKHLACWCGKTQAKREIVRNQLVLRCYGCGTLRQDVALSDEGIKEFYTKYYHRGWRELVEKEIPYAKRFDEDTKLSQLRSLQWLTVMKEPGTWLDVGSANGALPAYLRSKGWTALGLDFDASQAEENNEKLATTWENAKEYDVISYIDVLEHGFVREEIERALEHLKPNGKIIVEFPVAQEEPKHFRRLQHLWYFTDETFTRFVHATGLRILSLVKPISGKRTAILGRA